MCYIDPTLSIVKLYISLQNNFTLWLAFFGAKFCQNAKKKRDKKVLFCCGSKFLLRCIKNLSYCWPFCFLFLYFLSFCSTFLLILFQHQHGHKMNHIDVSRYRVVYGIIFQNMINLNSSMCMGIKIQGTTKDDI